MDALPHDVYGLIAFAIVAFLQWWQSRKTRKHTTSVTVEQTDTLDARLADVDDRVSVVAFRLDEHINATDRRVRAPNASGGGHTHSEPYPIESRRRRSDR